MEAMVWLCAPWMIGYFVALAVASQLSTLP